MRTLSFLLPLIFLSTVSFAQDSGSPVPDAIQEGTMTNQKLRQDALPGVIAWLGSKGCKDAPGFSSFVTKLPEGNVGSRSWQEAWVARCSNGEFTVRIDFRESGHSAADWTIR